MRNKDLWIICMNIYRQMFKEAKPSADFDELMETGEARQPEFFMKYYLSQEIEDKIIDEICKENKINKWDKLKIKNTVYLGCSPNSCLKTWKEEKEKSEEKRSLSSKELIK